MRTLLLLLLLPATITAQEANFAGVTGNAEASNCDISKATGVVINGENGEYLNCVSFTMSATIKKKTVEVPCTGKKLCDDAKTLIKALKSGDTLNIDNIIAENAYGIAIEMPAITITVTICGASPE